MPVCVFCRKEILRQSNVSKYQREAFMSRPVSICTILGSESNAIGCCFLILLSYIKWESHNLKDN